MYFIIGAIAALGILVYIGRLSKAGRLKSGPWFRQRGTVAAVLAIAIGISGIIATMRGAYILGGLLISLALAMAGAARLRGGDNSRPTQFIRTQAEIEAYKTLGLPIGSDKKAILKAWKTKMKAAHPDQGGTDEHAAKLNAARDLLLRLR